MVDGGGAAPRRAPVLALDGPSGVGKGSVGRAVAHELGWHYLDSGSLYRAAALGVERAGLAAASPERWVDLVAGLRMETQLLADGGLQVLLGDAEVSAEIRSERCSQLASQLAELKKVRVALLGLQRGARRLPGLVADGRDMGTTVFPDAVLKMFLTATPEVRAERRYKQLIAKGFDVTVPSLVAGLAKRDARDAEREVSPLMLALDAVSLDTSRLMLVEVVDRVRNLLVDRLRCWPELA